MQKSLELREKQAEKEEKQKTKKIETSAEKLRKLLKEEKRLKKKEENQLLPLQVFLLLMNQFLHHPLPLRGTKGIRNIRGIAQSLLEVPKGIQLRHPQIR